MMRDQDTAARYAGALEAFNAASLNDLVALCARDVEFKDPFNHTHTREDFRRVLEHMLSQVSDLQFDIQGRWQNSDATILKWRFTGQARFVGRLDIPGLSEVCFNDQGLVCRHIDYWDANEHITSRLPVAGSIVRRLTRPLSV